MKTGLTVFSYALRQQCQRLLLTGIASILVGCTSVWHDPLYRASAHDSTITVSSFYLAGINRITLTVTTGQMIDCGVAIPCHSMGALETKTVCDFTTSPSLSAACIYTQHLGDESLVTYKAEIELVGGKVMRSEAITYAGGFFPPKGIARPVWWHHDVGSDLDLASKIDIGFFPDEDYYGDYTAFTQDLETIARGAFFNYNESFAITYTFFRSRVNLWAAPFGADATRPYNVSGTPRCPRDFSDPLVSPIAGIVDGRVIVHKEYFDDCAAIALGGGGSVNASSARPDVNFVHESGHFLHAQGDEYDEGVLADSAGLVARAALDGQGSCVNIFPSEQECWNTAPSHWINTPNCVQIPLPPDPPLAWRNEEYDMNGNEQYDIMKDLGPNSGWQNDCLYCVVQRFLRCRSGLCYY